MTTMTDTESLELELSAITDPRDILQWMIENEHFIGGDPYYANLNRILWKHVERVLELTKPREGTVGGALKRHLALAATNTKPKKDRKR